MKKLEYDYKSVDWDAARGVYDSKNFLCIKHFSNTLELKTDRDKGVYIFVNGGWSGAWHTGSHPFSAYFKGVEIRPFRRPSKSAPGGFVVAMEPSNYFSSIEDVRQMVEALPDHDIIPDPIKE